MKRTGFIGGSDCVKIMQGDWLELWQIKTGRADPPDLSKNLAVQMGIHTEDFNLDWFETEYDCVLSDHQRHYRDKIGLVPARGTVDAMFGDAVVEAKHTNSFNKMDDIIKRYMPQIQLYCKLAEAPDAYLSVIFGNSKWSQQLSRTITSISILCGQWCQISGVTLHATKSRLVMSKLDTYQPTPFRWTTWSYETPRQATSLSASQPHTFKGLSKTKYSRTQRSPSKKWLPQMREKLL